MRDFIRSRRSRLAGVRTVWSSDDLALVRGFGSCHGGQLRCGAYLLSKFGIPYTTRRDAKGPALLAGGVAEVLSDTELRTVLSGGVLVDAVAAGILVERGFGDLLGTGVEPAEGRLPVTGETILPAAGCTRRGKSVNAFYIFSAGTEGTVERFAKLDPRPGSEVWSRFTGPDGEVVTPSLTFATNALGGRVAVLATSLVGNRSSGLFNLRKQELMQNLFRRMDPAAIPAEASGVPGIWILAQVSEANDEMLLMVDNLSGDVRADVDIAVGDDWIGSEVSRLGQDGKPIPVGTLTGRWRLPFALGQMEPEFLVVSKRNSGHPNLVVGIVSDPHANSPENNRYLRKALEYFRARQVDAVAIPGDFGFVAKHGELLESSRTWFDVFPDDRLPDGRKVERLFITGNHDEDGWRYGKAKKVYGDEPFEKAAFAFNRQAFWREAWHEDYEPVFVKTVKGYRFVCRHWLPLQDYAKNPFPAWFASHRNEIPTDRPFFYLQHETLTGATRHPSAGKVVKGRSWDGADDGTAARILADYPNCVALTGHLHNPLSFDTGIWQGAFTAVDCGSANAWGFTWPGRENGHPGGQEMPMCDVADQRHCLVMSVYGDRIVFERRCLLNDEPLGDDWVVPIGSGAKRPYAVEAMDRSLPPPEFAPGATVRTSRGPGVDVRGNRHEQVTVSFPPVNGLESPHVRAFDYEIVPEFRGTPGNGACRNYRVFSSRCCLAPGRDTEDVVCRMNIDDFAGAEAVRFVVRPCDSRGRAGRSIVGEWMKL